MASPVRRYTFFASCPHHAEDLLASELEALGAESLRPHPAGVSFEGPLEVGYRACLWSRTAARVLLRIAEFPARTPDEVREGTRGVDWSRHMDLRTTFAVSCTMADSPIRHSHYGALLVKDGVADHFRQRTGERPSVDVERPALRLHVHLDRERAFLSVDLSGESLHRRGYRRSQGSAPLKENVAAAMLLRARWPEISAQGGGFLDPMCGAGTLVIEAALMALDIAPGLARSGFGFFGWKGHDPALWRRLTEEAWERRRRTHASPIVGYDADAQAVAAAKANALAAGLAGAVHFEVRRLADCLPPKGKPGLVAVNPPYGRRLERGENLVPLYEELGRVMRDRFAGWRMALLTAEPKLSWATGLRAERVNKLSNGSIPCEVTHFALGGAEHQGEPPVMAPPERSTEPAADPATERTAAAPMPGPRPHAEVAEEEKETLANRLRKNLRRLKPWARAEGVRCYRIYDADLPQYAVAIDWYEEKWAHVQEYAPPAEVEEQTAERRLRDVVQVIQETLGIPAECIFLKERRRQKGHDQYDRLDNKGIRYEVREGELRFLVNFTDYLDTGLFLDHRITRRMIAEMAAGRVFLNLFCYTASATVYAAWGGALRSVSVDTSNTYLAWARDNLRLNGFEGERHRLVRADARDFLASDTDRYGLVFIDPPTFSNSKGDRENFSVQRDHVPLIRAALEHLEPDGVIVFSNNFRKFRLDEEALAGLRLEMTDITQETIPPDFARNPRIHRCWLIRRAARSTKGASKGLTARSTAPAGRPPRSRRGR